MLATIKHTAYSRTFVINITANKSTMMNTITILTMFNSVRIVLIPKN
jgi:hypothetical protein